MSPSRSRAARRGAAAVLALLGAGVGALSCLPPGEIILDISTNMEPGGDFDEIEIEVCALDGASLGSPCSNVRFKDTYPLDVANALTATLPGTLGVTSPGDDPRAFSVSVRAFKRIPTGDDKFERVNVLVQGPVILQVPGDQMKRQPLLIDYLCRARDCEPTDPGTVCHNGDCILPECDKSPSLATCDPEQGDSPLCDIGQRCVNGTCVPELCPVEDDGSGPLADAQCFDVLACFADGWDVAVDPSTCKLLLEPDELSGINLALGLEKDQGDIQFGFCDDRWCLVPLDDQPKKDGRLSPAICDGIQKGTLHIVAAAITDDCPRKTAHAIAVSPLSSARECRPRDALKSGVPGLPELPWPPGESKPSRWSVRPEETSGSDSAGRLFAAAVRIDSSPAAGVLIVGGASSGASILELSGMAPDTKHYSMECMSDAPFETGQTCQFPYLLPEARAAHTATIIGGDVLVIGGIDDEGHLTADVERIGPSPGGSAISLEGPMTSPRAFHTATPTADGRVLIAGGVVDGGDGWTATDGIEIHDGENSMVPPGLMTNLNTASFGHTATFIPCLNRVLITGGQAELNKDALASAAFCDVSTEPSCALLADPMNQARAFHTATLLEGDQVKGDRVLITGGKLDPEQSGDFEATGSVEIYDCGAGCDSCGWITKTPMQWPRVFHTATLLPGGKVLVVGGLMTSGAPAPPELYDPDSDEWVSVEPHSAALRAFHTATLLSNGNVLVAGGGTLEPGNGQGAPTLVASENLVLYTP